MKQMMLKKNIFRHCCMYKKFIIIKGVELLDAIVWNLQFFRDSLSAMHSNVTVQFRQNEILLDCYRQFQDHCQSNNFEFDIKLLRTFQGPIELTTIKNKGRCFIAKKPIKSGQLILIEKAFVFSSRHHHSFYKLYNESNDNNNDNLEFDETAILMAELIKDRIIKKVSKSNNAAESINKLKYLYPRANEIDAFEEFQCDEYGIEEEHDLFLFNHSLSQLSHHKIKDNSGVNEVFVKRLPYVIYSNAMVITQHTEQLCYFKPIAHNFDEKYEKNELRHSAYSDMIGDAIYLKGSFFNHDCSPNLNRYFIGDILVVKAVKDIKVGEECTFSYLETEHLCESESFRSSRLPFDCNCEKCILERSENDESHDDDEKDDSDEEEEEESEDDDLIFDETQCASLFSMEPSKRIEIIGELMKVHDLRHCDIISGYTAKAMAYLELKRFGDAAKCWMQCVDCIKRSFGEIHEHMVPFYLQCILCKIAELIPKRNDIEIIKKNQDVMKLIQKMLKVHDTCFGGGSLFFLQRYSTELSLSAYSQRCKSFYGMSF